jgi:hypothetical protein
LSPIAWWGTASSTAADRRTATSHMRITSTTTAGSAAAVLGRKQATSASVAIELTRSARDGRSRNAATATGTYSTRNVALVNRSIGVSSSPNAAIPATTTVYPTPRASSARTGASLPSRVLARDLGSRPRRDAEATTRDAPNTQALVATTSTASASRSARTIDTRPKSSPSRAGSTIVSSMAGTVR